METRLNCVKLYQTDLLIKNIFRVIRASIPGNLSNLLTIVKETTKVDSAEAYLVYTAYLIPSNPFSTHDGSGTF